MKPFSPRRPLRALCPLWVWTLCLALALRALVPSGTMLDLEKRDGFFPGLVLCPVQNPGMPARGHHHSDDRPQTHASPLCLLAQHAGGSPLPAAAPAPASAAQTAAAPFLPGITAPAARRVRWVPLGSRAPPPPFIQGPSERLQAVRNSRLAAHPNPQRPLSVRCIQTVPDRPFPHSRFV
ncbi:DUF2946 family protein [Castellaniella ginsengisoli]